MDPFEGLPKGHYGAILADPPWLFKVRSDRVNGDPEQPWSSRRAEKHYQTMEIEDIGNLPVATLAAESCVLFIWVTWPLLEDGLAVLKKWGFEYKTCAFAWTKAHAGQIEMFRDDVKDQMGLGFWTRSNTEVCLLATRGTPKRLNKDVRQAIIAPRRQHSRKPDGIHERIERLVAGPYLEMFARQRRPNWDSFGNETDKFNGGYDAQDDMRKSIELGFKVIRDRIAAGGEPWVPKPVDK